MSVMDFLVNKMGWEPAAIGRYPTVFLRSLEKKIIPWCSVVKVLQIKRLVKKDLSLSFLGSSKKNFFNRFVVKYEHDVPELLNVYQGKIGILELGFISEGIMRDETVVVSQLNNSKTAPEHVKYPNSKLWVVLRPPWDSKHLDGKNRSNSRASVHPVLLVQLVLKWKLLQDLGSFLTVLPKQNVQSATCWAFY
ncbi:hypothetical protein CK203_063331 [Vitis vinifera]|uniref:Uncharacterized protein n=1 Tax=Vitis vinifera TaxID=29760 RepID=A0A438FPA1_VITVI|nr:hypothetical protein CK203_063331 [Vitis vinifera]